MPTERISILEAIGMAGDLSVYGKRGNVLLIRNGEEFDQRKIVVRLNLSSKALFSSPYFYLRPNDIIYVEPRPRFGQKVLQEITPYLSIITTSLTLFLLLK